MEGRQNDSRRDVQGEEERGKKVCRLWLAQAWHAAAKSSQRCGFGPGCLGRLHIPRLTHTQAEKARAAHTPQALQAALGRDCSSARCGAAPVEAREVRALRLSRCRSAIQHEHPQLIANAGLAALHGWPLQPSPSTPAVFAARRRSTGPQR